MLNQTYGVSDSGFSKDAWFMLPVFKLSLPHCFESMPLLKWT